MSSHPSKALSHLGLASLAIPVPCIPVAEGRLRVVVRGNRILLKHACAENRFAMEEEGSQSQLPKLDDQPVAATRPRVVHLVSSEKGKVVCVGDVVVGTDRTVRRASRENPQPAVCTYKSRLSRWRRHRMTTTRLTDEPAIQ